MKSIKIFAPATIANLSCGFDVLGLCLEGIGDEMTITKTNTPGVRITAITGADLSRVPEENVAGVAALALLSQWATDYGFDIEIHKKIPPGSGIGSSSASASGVVYGINELLGRPFSPQELLPFAMQGEFLASNSLHADNVAPALLGGITLIRGYDPLDVIEIPAPAELYAAVLSPHIELKTSASRAVLPKELSLKTAVAQWGNLAGFVAGLYTQDYDLISRSLQDHVAEPYRASLIPGFHEAKNAALQCGALGAGISGSGPSIFALCQGSASAMLVLEAMTRAYDTLNVSYNAVVSRVSETGARTLES